VYQKPPRLLKKSPSERSVVRNGTETPRNRVENTIKMGFLASFRGSNKGTKEFFNTLGRF
jgi:hypothetical protein